MSTKSIKAFQSAYPRWKPSPAAELRNEAAKLRAFGQSMLAKANRLEEIASELEPPARDEIRADMYICVCNSVLQFVPQPGGGLVCRCVTCEKRADRGDGAISVYGYGRDAASAYADWQRAQERF